MATLPTVALAASARSWSLRAAGRTVLRRLDVKTVAYAMLAVMAAELICDLEYVQFPAPDLWVFEQYPFIDPLAKLLAIVPAIFLADALVAQGARPLRTYATCVTLGAIVASALQAAMRVATDTPLIPFLNSPPLSSAMQPFYVASLLTIHAGGATLIYTYLRSAFAANSVRRRVELARLGARRTTLELRLQSIQARIDPTFLFETLSEIGPLYEADPARADRLLDDLIAYLRAALPRPFDAPSAFAQELELVRAYVGIIAARRDRPIEVSTDVDEAANAVHLPPMLVLPLVTHLVADDDALCALHIGARISNRRLKLVLESDSRKPCAPLPLALRERLTQLFEDDFGLDEPRRFRNAGPQITIEVPLVVADRRRR